MALGGHGCKLAARRALVAMAVRLKARFALVEALGEGLG